MPLPLSEIICGALIIYPSERDQSKRAKDVRASIWAIKEGRTIAATGEPGAVFAARRLAEEMSGSPLDGFFQDAVLVPAPGSAKLLPPRFGPQLWATRDLCEALVDQGLGDAVAPIVTRTETVPSGSRTRKHQPLSRHLETIDVTNPRLIPPGSRIVIVDDVITSGNTLFAAANHISRAYPGNEIVGFAVSATHPILALGPLWQARYRVSKMPEKDWCWRRIFDEDDSWNRERVLREASEP